MFKTAWVVTALLGSSPQNTQPPPAPAMKTVTFEGACDASGAVVQGPWMFTVADDEDNVIRVYDGKSGGGPVRTSDLSAALALPAGKKRAPETDIEAATELPRSPSG
ncbi:hypothetical protein ACN28I_37510 [Archangium gephyra]|uniref:hypothetical protein n=1 Tax=Archangium gephyra TaxID=48 RepID=UPI003B7FB52B